jgi:hypothetical protein
MSFFNEQKTVTDDEIVEYEFNQTEEFCYSMYSFSYEISPNGGSILITRNLLSDDTSSGTDELLGKNVMVHSSDGMRFAKIPLPANTVGLNFLADERILLLRSDAFFMIYNPWDQNYEKSAALLELPHKNQFTPTGEYKGIKSVKIVENSFVVFTENNLLFLFYDLESIKIKQLLGKDAEYDLENFSMKQIAYYPKPNGRTFVFYIACHKSGILYFEFEKNIEKQTRILSHVTSRITHISLSFRRKLLAVLTESSTLHVFKSDNLTQQFKFELELSEIDRRRFQSIEFVKDQVVCVCFRNNFKFISIHFKGLVQKRFSSGLNSDSSPAMLLYKTERDGLRVICVKKYSRIVMIRKVSKAYESVKGMISMTPGASLYSNYKSFLKQIPPEDEDIIDNKGQLKKGIEEVLKAARFELNTKKQKKLVMAACHGKVFLEDEDFNNYVLYQFCKVVKLWNALRSQTSRTITFRQFEALLSSDFNNIIMILLNCKRFELAFHFCTYMEKEKHFINQIFQKWVVVLLSKAEAEEQCAARILDTFNKVASINENISSTILIDIAGSALAMEKKEIARILLQRENPPLLKIALYINMQQLENALMESLEAYDSNCIYLILNKMMQTWDSKEVIEKIAKFNNPIINDHFYRLLEVDQNAKLKTSFAKNLRDPKTFYIRNYKEYINVDDLKNFSELAGRNIAILKDTASRTEKSKRGSMTILDNALSFWKVADESIQSLSPELLATHIEDIFYPLFKAQKEVYLGNPASSFDKLVIDRASKLRLSEKRLGLLRLNFMLDNLPAEKLDIVVKFIELNKRRNISLTQLKIIFNKRGYSQEFISVLEIHPIETAFAFCTEKLMFYEAAWISVTAKSREKFEEVIKKVTDKGKQERLYAMAGAAFK